METESASARRPDARTLAFWAAGVPLCAAGAWILGDYLQAGPPTVVAVASFVVLALALSQLPRHAWRPREVAWLAGYACLLSASIVVASHVVVTNGYTGTMADNYLTPLSSFDLLAWVLVACAAGIAAGGLWSLVSRAHDASGAYVPDAIPVRLRDVAPVAAVIFACWIPWLVAWWPGFVFPDSISSLRQALGLRGFVNQHPVMYALLIRAEFALGGLFGLDHTGCVGLYSVVQMGFCATCLGYLTCWVCERGKLRLPWKVALTMAFGLIRYVASMSIAVWKDPAWSYALVVLSLMLYDLVVSRASCAARPTWVAGLCCLLFVVTFIRTNGIAVDALLLLVFGVALLVTWRRKPPATNTAASRAHRALFGGLRTVCVALLAAVALYAVYVGPVFSMLEVADLPEERVGLELNQMVRVVAYNGQMSPEDRAYMASIAPIDQYRDLYRPCCIDMFKWAYGTVDLAPIREGFWGHWMSMLVRNPRIYLEQWVMQTHGFWAVNAPHINAYDQNVRRGDPLNIFDDDGGWLDDTNVAVSKPAKGSALEVLDFEVWALPIGWCAWAMAFLAVCLVLAGEWRWLAALLPCVAVEGTLLLASPIWYWPRYAMSLQFMMPVVALLMWFLVGRRPAPRLA